MLENKKEVVVMEFDLPEFEREDIFVKVERNKVHIEAKKKDEKRVDEDDFKWFEKSSRSFNYVSSLPPVIGKDAKVEFEKGILRITVPKK